MRKSRASIEQHYRYNREWRRLNTLSAGYRRIWPLTVREVRLIRKLYHNLPLVEIAKKLRVSYGYAWQVANGRRCKIATTGK